MNAEDRRGKFTFGTEIARNSARIVPHYATYARQSLNMGISKIFLHGTLSINSYKAMRLAPETARAKNVRGIPNV